ncbi:TnpA family transposase [Rhizobium ruizarguesonis]
MVEPVDPFQYDVVFYRADKALRYRHIDSLFTREIDWKLIETHWQDMMQVVLSIQAGLVLPSMLLRKLGSYNRKSLLCLAFRELGRVKDPVPAAIHLPAANKAGNPRRNHQNRVLQ